MFVHSTILLIKHEASMLKFLLEFFKSESFEIGQGGSLAVALSEIKKRNWDVILLNLGTPSKGGLTVFREIRLLSPDSPIVVMSGYAFMQDAVEAMKLGAFDYIIKPFENDDLIHVIKEAIKYSAVNNLRPKLNLKEIRGTNIQPPLRLSVAESSARVP